MEQRVTILGAMVAQASAALLLTVLLVGYYLYYRKRYLREWAMSWVNLLAYQLAAPLAFYLSMSLDAMHPSRITLALVASVAGYLQPAYLVFGSWEVSRHRPVRVRTRRFVLIGVALAGILAALPYISSGAAFAAQRYFVRFGIKSFAVAAAFIAAAVLIWRSRSHRGGPGFRMVSIGFLLFGLQQAHYFALASFWVFTGRTPQYLPYLGFLDFVLLCFIGIGMVTCLLEDEREALVHATEQIEHLAYHDSLTGLPNRALFFDRLIMAIARVTRTKHRLAVFFIDLDRFKEINDSLGHTAGDQLLKLVAARIRSSTRDTDSFARFGGDEFTLLVEQVGSADDAARVAQKIIESLRVPFQVGDRELFVSGSVGISIFPDDAGDAETLVRNADTAMYRAKEQGRDDYQLYAPAMNASALERLALEQMLRKALVNEELLLYYQPLIRIQEQEVVFGVEALLRWQHPDLGVLSPVHFISAAENSGLIVPIGAWVLQEACKQVRVWQRKLGVDLVVSINLSARQFQQPTLFEEVRTALATSGLDPALLELEITESSAMQNAENTVHTLRELKKLGILIAMDDFGTGYSSLNYLKRFPIDTLKLDQSFVTDLATDDDDRAIATAILALARSLELEVIAEGVETEEQLAFLRERNCERFQGFYFSAPLPPDQLEEYLGGFDAAAVAGKG